MGVGWPLTGRTDQVERLAAWYGDPEVGGVVVGGPAGVGKTRLTEEVARLARAAGRPFARAVGHPATLPIPLGVLAHVLAPEVFAGLDVGADEHATLFHRARACLTELAGDDRLLLVADDVDQFDETSLAVLLPLVNQRVVFLVAAVRSGRAVPAAVASLLKDGHLQRLELAPLGRDAVATLLHRVLDGPLDLDGLDRLATLSGGNMQVLSELVRAAREQGTLVRHGEVWRVGELPTTATLEELVMTHLAGVGPAGREALEVLALAGRAGPVELAPWCPAPVLEELEGDGLVRAAASGRRTELSLAHPLYGEVLRSRMSVLRLRAIRRALADGMEEQGARRRDDAPRLALWRLEDGGALDAGLLLRAARLALAARDVRLAERFARAGLDGGPVHGGVPGAVGGSAQVLAETHVLLARHDELEALVSSMWARDDLSDGDRSHLTRKLADSRLTARRDVDGALAVGDRALAVVTEPVDRASLLAHRASMLATVGRPLAALAALEQVPPSDDARVRVETAAARSNALLMLGRCDLAVVAAREGQAAQQGLPPWLARRGAVQHLVNEAHALAYCGRYREAEALVRPAWERAAATRSSGASVWLEIVLAEIARDRGRGAEAIAHFTAAGEVAERVGQGAALVWTHVGVAQGALLLGDAAAAAAAMADADAVGDSPIATSSTTRERCRAWLEACRGDLPAARRRLAAIAEETADDGIFVFEMALRHDLVRFGDAAAAAERLTELEGMVDGPLVRAMASHARGVQSGDVDELESSLAQFEEIDALVLAAETAADLAERWRRVGDQRAATAAARRAAALAEAAGGARTPALRRGHAVEPLTSREREVALLAAGGAASKEIAGQLYLSTRTVDTHLARVYRKLGVAGRDELAAALEQAAPPT